MITDAIKEVFSEYKIMIREKDDYLNWPGVNKTDIQIILGYNSTGQINKCIDIYSTEVRVRDLTSELRMGGCVNRNSVSDLKLIKKLCLDYIDIKNKASNITQYLRDSKIEQILI